MTLLFRINLRASPYDDQGYDDYYYNPEDNQIYVQNVSYSFSFNGLPYNSPYKKVNYETFRTLAFNIMSKEHSTICCYPHLSKLITSMERERKLKEMGI